ncbi:GDCCVxC domain-containing (seleno)protein [Caballeronia arationis]
MHTDACVWFNECEHCKTVLEPEPRDCCVHCLYGTNRCPSMQQSGSCCA